MKHMVILEERSEYGKSLSPVKIDKRCKTMRASGNFDMSYDNDDNHNKQSESY